MQRVSEHLGAAGANGMIPFDHYSRKDKPQIYVVLHVTLFAETCSLPYALPLES